MRGPTENTKSPSYLTAAQKRGFIEVGMVFLTDLINLPPVQHLIKY